MFECWRPALVADIARNQFCAIIIILLTVIESGGDSLESSDLTGLIRCL